MAFEKSTLADVKERLTAGHYANITGALRGIGRMESLTDRQRTMAQNLAYEHFGVQPKEEGAAAPKKAAKKAGRKPAVKKAAKKSAAAVKAPKAAARVAQQKAAAEETAAPAPTGAKRGRKPGTKMAPKASVSAASLTEEVAVQAAKLKIGTYRDALEAMEKAKNLGASESVVAQDALDAQRALGAVVRELCAAPPSPGEMKAAAVLEVVAAATHVNEDVNGVDETDQPQVPSRAWGPPHGYGPPPQG